jgi:hypothetical protein
MSRTQKIEMIAKAIARFKKEQGVMVQKDVGFYVYQIDKVYADNAELNDDDVGSVLRALAVTFRDFDNGEDPEALIRAEFGEEQYQSSLKDKRAMEEIYNEYMAWKKARSQSNVDPYDRDGIPGKSASSILTETGVIP